MPLSSSPANTPDSTSIETFLPFAWQGSEFPSSDIEPALASLKSEGYQVTHAYAQSTLTSASQATSIPRFLGAASAGIVIIYGHGAADFLPLETFPKTAAGKAAALSALWKYETAYPSSNPKKPALDYFGWTTGKTSYQVGLRALGVSKLWEGGHTLVILAVCHGQGLAQALYQAGAQAVLYWPNFNYSVYTGNQLKAFFSRLDGTAHPDAGLDANTIRSTLKAYNDCKACQSGRNPMKLLASTPMTLAPAVTSRLPDPKTPVEVGGTPFTVKVSFDTKMETRAPPSEVVTLKGCGSSGPNHDGPAADTALKWTDNAITGTFRPTETGQLTITVHSDKAVSANNGTHLDGNQHGSNDTPVAPNKGNDFTWKATCQAASVHMVFTGTGMAQRSTRSDSGNGFVTTNTGTDQISWTAAFDLNLRQVSGSGQPAGYHLQSGTFDQAASSLTGTSSSASSIDACPTDQCSTSPPCSGTFTRSDDPSPELYVYSPPAADGALTVLVPPYFVLQSSSGCGPVALGDTCDPLLAGTPGTGSSPTAGIGPLTATITINPKTWKPGSFSVQPVAPISWSCQSSDGKVTDTGSVSWSGTVTLSVPDTSSPAVR